MGMVKNPCVNCVKPFAREAHINAVEPAGAKSFLKWQRSIEIGSLYTVINELEYCLTVSQDHTRQLKEALSFVIGACDCCLDDLTPKARNFAEWEG